MKKTRLTLLCISAVLLAGCSNAKGGGAADSQQDAYSAAADSTAVTEEEVTKEEVFITPDLTLYELKGHVKSLSTGDGVTLARFNEAGEITHCMGTDKISNVKRDADGRLVSFLGDEWMTITWKDGLPVKVEGQMNEWDNTNTYKYDEAGRVIENTLLAQWAGEDDETTVFTITYPSDAFDENGNWIKRIRKSKSGTETEIRRIIYY